MIGVFDSGLGGVLTATYIREHLPAYDLFIVADEQYAPYGARDHIWIRERTFTCLHWMFDQGCSMVILACNTASTAAIIEWQQHYPEKKVLSISIPGMEGAIEQGYHHIGILATQISVTMNLYPSMFAKHYPEYEVAIEQVIGNGLVEAIEEGDIATIEILCKLYAAQFSHACEAIILGCTHYPLILPSLQKNLPDDVHIVNPGVVAAEKLIVYFQRHPIVAQQCTTCTGGGAVRILSTKLSPHFIHMCQQLWYPDISIEAVVI